MKQTLDYDFFKNFLLILSNTIIQKKDYLNKLDAACGDGDFGISMYRGFKSAQEIVTKGEDNSIHTLFNTFGKAILHSAGGASGPIFGTLFIEAGKKIIGKEEINLNDLALMFDNALEKIQLRGKAGIGDKTLIDALDPAVKSLKESALKNLNISDALKIAADSSKRGAESTKNMVAKQGKARYVGQHSIGYLDPGAEMIQILFKKLLEAYQPYC